MTYVRALKELRVKVTAGQDTGRMDTLAAKAFPPENTYGTRTFYLVGQAFHGSLDAAKALHEAVLSGWGWTVSDNAQVTLWPPGSIDEQNKGAIEIELEDTPARAWLLAILDALIAEAGE